MRLTDRMAQQLRIAFSIYARGKDGSFWFARAEREWRATYGDIDVTPEVWDEVLALLADEFPSLLNSKVREGIEGFKREKETA